VKPRASVIYWTVAVIGSDIVAVIAATLISYFFRFQSGILPVEEFHPVQNYYGYIATLVVVEPIVLAANGLYRARRSISWIDQVYGIFTSTSVATAIAIVNSAVLWRDVSSSRLLIGLGWLLSVIFVTVGRFLAHHFQSSVRRRGVGTERLLIVGTGEPASMVLDRVRHAPGMGYRAVGFVG
jgi:FlaA1/EpsC-like NDP-sugar epimerase